MTKDILRQIYKTKRAELQLPVRLKMDDLILLQFQQMNYTGIHTVLSYWPLSHQAEPNTELFSGFLKHLFPSVILCYPKTAISAVQLTAWAIDEDSVFHTNRWGITEPKEGILIHPAQIDLVFVPLLAFDTKGYRVGYGKGYYDRFLAECRKDIVKIGFSYFEPIDQITDTNQFDVPLTYCITPQHIYEF